MIDVEKVIKDLEFCVNGHYKVELSLATKILVLLKEQEPIVPGLEQDANGIYSTCGNCKTRLWKLFGVEFEVNPDAMPKFCPQCGRAVKWNE